jgi:hypothetical protein
MHLFNSAGSLAPPTEPTAVVFEFRPLASIFAVAASPAAVSPTEASTCGEKAFPHPLFVSPEPHALPPLAGRRPSAPLGATPRPPLKPPVQAPL